MDHMSLNVVEILSPQNKRAFFGEQVHATWIVADVRTKELLQKERLRGRLGISGYAVMRASELWIFYAENLLPELELISPDFAEVFLHELMQSHEFRQSVEQMGLQPKTIVGLWSFYDEILVNAATAEKFLQFLNDEKLEEKLRAPFEIAYSLLQYMLQKKWTLPGPLPALLFDKIARSDDFVQLASAFGTQKLIFDLGSSARGSEVDLILEISRHVDVTVILPPTRLLEEASGLKYIYEKLTSRAPATSLGEKKAATELGSPIDAFQFAHPIAELRWALEQAQTWIDRGEVKPAEIVIAKARFSETELELIREHGFNTPRLDVSHVLPQSHLPFQKLQSEIRSSSGQMRPGDNDLLHVLETGEILEHRAAASATLGAATRAKRRDSLSDQRTLLTIFEFLKTWAPRFRLSDRMRNEIIRLPLDFRAGTESWAYWLDLQAAKSEKRSAEMSISETIYFETWRSLDDIPAKRRILLGLDLRSVRDSRSVQFLTASESMKFFYQSGIYLKSAMDSENDFDLQWILSEQSAVAQTILTFSEVDFSGTQNSPHGIWVQAALAKSKDELAPKPPPRVISEKSRVPVKLLRERSLVSRRVSEISPVSLSASNVGRFNDCSAIYLYEKVFSLRDYDEVDEFGSHRSRGTFYHRLFERANLVEVAARNQLDEAAFVEDTFQEFRPAIFHSHVWAHEKAKAISTLQQFFLMEQELRKLYPDFKVESVEREFSFEYPIDGIPTIFRGRIDRIEDAGIAGRSLVDFKSQAQFPTPLKWLEKNKTQFLFYLWVLLHDPGLTREEYFERVVEWSYKNMERREFARADVEPLLADFENLLRTIVHRIHAGEFEARPRDDDLDLCLSCRWFQICRNPHLLQY